ncbi:MAG: hypothetical protein K2P88_06170 [Chitinophagaceae bacterium]|nr:hypothetical protein [Chitinophagaceae bacterium]
MDHFINPTTEVSRLINEKAGLLYEKLTRLQVDQLGMPEACLIYFKGSHFTRLFFSIQTSAHLLNRALQHSGKKPEELCVMDYGAGVGTLYSLAKMIGCKVVYNDHLEDWKKSAQLIAEAIGVQVDHYVVGDIDTTLDYLDQHQIKVDVILSRNVVEHIYSLRSFFELIDKRAPDAMIISSTTANFNNPASRWKHARWHKKWEPAYLALRKKYIQDQFPQLSEGVWSHLAVATRGMSYTDIKRSVEAFIQNKTVPDPTIHRTNTCDPEYGVWAEHIIPFSEYRTFIPQRYQVLFAAGFWDTHYRSVLKRLLGKTMNALQAIVPVFATHLAPFIYVEAIPKKDK